MPETLAQLLTGSFMAIWDDVLQIWRENLNAVAKGLE